MIFKSRERAVRAEALLESARAALAGSAKLVREYGLQIAALKVQLAETNALSAENQELKIKYAVLVERLDLLTNYGLGQPKASAPRVQGPTAMPEEAEDALFAYRNGDIDKTGLEQILRSSGYDNTEIEFELTDYPRHAIPQQ